jgi:hypothetical protein
VAVYSIDIIHPNGHPDSLVCGLAAGCSESLPDFTLPAPTPTVLAKEYLALARTDAAEFWRIVQSQPFFHPSFPTTQNFRRYWRHSGWSQSLRLHSVMLNEWLGRVHIGLSHVSYPLKPLAHFATCFDRRLAVYVMLSGCQAPCRTPGSPARRWQHVRKKTYPTKYEHLGRFFPGSRRASKIGLFPLVAPGLFASALVTVVKCTVDDLSDG